LFARTVVGNHVGRRGYGAGIRTGTGRSLYTGETYVICTDIAALSVICSLEPAVADTGDADHSTVRQRSDHAARGVRLGAEINCCITDDFRTAQGKILCLGAAHIFAADIAFFAVYGHFVPA